MTEKATFGAGCFWGVEEAFRTMKGVVKTRVGYTGGNLKEPSYEDVCTDKTGHAEAVQLEFEPKQVSYEQLLDKFWSIHDPTQMNRQGPDIGTQYRSVIFYHNEMQKKQALKSKEKEQEKCSKKIVTAIEPASEFYEAEEYHQKYLMKKGAKTCG
jgi:peptide-methionine (S)-S-oxide reductase